MQGNAPDEEHEDMHGECAVEIGRLKSEVARLRGTISGIASINRVSAYPNAGIRNACDEILYSAK